MEESLSNLEQLADKRLGILEAVSSTYELKDIDAGMVSPLALAYIGDGVYELVVRTILISEGSSHVDKLNARASSVCRASAQAALAAVLKEELTAQEAAAYRRGRNAKSASKAKNATMADYRHATGLEALCGYLYLNKETERLAELLCKGMRKLGFLGLDKEKNDGLS